MYQQKHSYRKKKRVIINYMIIYFVLNFSYIKQLYIDEIFDESQIIIELENNNVMYLGINNRKLNNNIRIQK